jgi:hypothetical protein
MRLQILACWHETRLKEAEVIAGNKLDYDNRPSYSKVVERSTHNLTFKGSNLENTRFKMKLSLQFLNDIIMI